MTIPVTQVEAIALLNINTPNASHRKTFAASYELAYLQFYLFQLKISDLISLPQAPHF